MCLLNISGGGSGSSSSNNGSNSIDINLTIAKTFKCSESIFFNNLKRLLKFECFYIFENRYILKSQCTSVSIKKFGEEMIFLKAKIRELNNIDMEGLLSQDGENEE